MLVVYLGLDFELPIWACLAVIALAAWLNVALRLRFRLTQRVEPERAAWLLAFDIAELAILLFLTGGLENPFAFLFLGPVLLSAAALPPRLTLMLGGFAAACATVLIFVHYPLPWDVDQPLELPPIYTMGVWSRSCWRSDSSAPTRGSSPRRPASSPTRSPPPSWCWRASSISRSSTGWPPPPPTSSARPCPPSRSSPPRSSARSAPNSPHADDVKLLREQAQRCPRHPGQLTQLSLSAEPFDRMPLSGLIEETVAPHRNFGVAIEVALRPEDAAEPIGRRNPVILYGLGNLLENAVDFARERVDVTAEWSAQEITLTINDDGPGFAPEIMDRIGEPYVTGRRNLRHSIDVEAGGLGLGLFIAKTLLERSGAKLVFANRAAPAQGACVRVRWARADFEQSPVPPL